MYYSLLWMHCRDLLHSCSCSQTENAMTLLHSKSVFSAVVGVGILLAVLGSQTSAWALTVTLTPSNLNFGQVSLGNSATLPAKLTNTGTSSITVYRIYANDSNFKAEYPALPVTLQPGSSLALNVTFTPTSSGSDSGLVAFRGAYASLAVYGSGTTSSGTTGRLLPTNPPNVAFGSVQSGGSMTKSVTVTNNRSHSVTLSSESITGAGFAVQGLSLPLSLDAGQSYTFNVSFSPQSAASVSGSLQVLNPRSNTIISLPLSGTGTATGQLALSPSSASFGNVTVGSSASKAGSLTATGASVTVTSASSSSSEFKLSGITLPVTIPAGQSASYSVTFTPQSSGTSSGAVSFTSNANSTTESLTGTGVAPVQHSVSLLWDPSGSQVSGYNVYRGTASGGPYSRINSGLDLATTFVDSTVSSAQTYYYMTTAVNSNGQESTYSNQVQVN